MKEDAFLIGEIVYLARPDVQRDIVNGVWHTWFNDMEITRFLVHGVHPISREQEVEIVNAELKRANSLVLCIFSKDTDQHVGVISLKGIDLINRNAEIAIVMGKDPKPGMALEAMALLTEHGFERLNLQKLYAGQHEGLWSWVNSLELIGYRIEGFREHASYRFGRPADSYMTGITSDAYFKLIKQNGGKLYSSELYKKKRKENIFPKVKAFFRDLYGPE